MEKLIRIAAYYNLFLSTNVIYIQLLVVIMANKVHMHSSHVFNCLLLWHSTVGQIGQIATMKII